MIVLGQGFSGFYFRRLGYPPSPPGQTVSELFLVHPTVTMVAFRRPSTYPPLPPGQVLNEQFLIHPTMSMFVFRRPLVIVPVEPPVEPPIEPPIPPVPPHHLGVPNAGKYVPFGRPKPWLGHGWE